MPTENRSNDADGWIACDDGLHLIQMDKNLSHYGWVFRKINGGLPYSVREATAHEMAHALARQHLRIGVAQIAGQAPADPGEVERLRSMFDQTNTDLRKVTEERDVLRAQLAEAHALLRDSSGKLMQMAAHLIGTPLRGLHDLQDEDKRMTRPRVGSAVEFADGRLKDAAYEIRRIADALSASAEPSASAMAEDKA
ncbi:hypothetical protein ACIQSO_21870 [Pseudomonas putida]|uniref:hypothetical protein n=1 Tax=Pseudomonas putida TaxID=303 RepID=UPI003839E068